MFDLSKGQAIAAQWFGLAPFWWGWVAAIVAICIALLAWIQPRPAWASASGPWTDLDERGARRWTWAVILAALVLHAPGFLGSFNLFDDTRQIHGDAMVVSLSWDSFRLMLFGNYRGTNQELMYVSFQLNWALAGKIFALWYLFNWLLVIPLLLLVSRLARRLTDHTAAGPLAAAVFATTPIFAELLCWMSVRSHLYGLLFTLAASVAWVEYVRGAGRRRFGWMALALLAFFLSQLSKPAFLFLPVWLILFDLYLRRRDVWVAIADKIPFFAVGAFFAYKIAAAGAGKRLIMPEPIGGSWFHTVLLDFNLLVEYGRTLFLRVQTGILPHWNAPLGWMQVDGTPNLLVPGFSPLASLIVLLAVLAVVVALRVRFGWGLPLLWYLAAGVSFATVLNIPNRGTAAVFEYRYTLSAQVVTAILLAAIAVRILAFRTDRPGWRHVPGAVVAAYLCWGAFETAEMTAAWRTSVSYWEHCSQLYPRSYYSHYYAGKSYQHASMNHTALQHLYRALQFHNGDMILYRRLGDNEYYVGNFPKAREWWEKFFWEKPRDVTDTYRTRFEEVGLDIEKMEAHWRERKR